MKIIAQYTDYDGNIVGITETDGVWAVKIYDGLEIFDEYPNHTIEQLDVVIATFIECIKYDIEIRFAHLRLGHRQGE